MTDLVCFSNKKEGVNEWGAGEVKILSNSVSYTKCFLKKSVYFDRIGQIGNEWTYLYKLLTFISPKSH